MQVQNLTGYTAKLNYWMQIFGITPKQVAVETMIPIGKIKIILDGSTPTARESELILRVLWSKAEDFLEEMANELDTRPN